MVGPIRSLPSGVVTIDFNPWPYDFPVCRIPLLRLWSRIQWVSIVNPRTGHYKTLGPSTFQYVGRLAVDTADLYRLMGREIGLTLHIVFHLCKHNTAQVAKKA